jgi:hypothetical protein
MRVFPGNVMHAASEPITAQPELDDDSRGNVAPPEEQERAAWQDEQVPMSAEAEVVDGDVVQETETAPVIDVDETAAEAQPAAEQPAGGRRSRSSRSRSSRQTGEGRAARKAADGTPARARKTSSKPRSTRSRSRARDTQPEE